MSSLKAETIAAAVAEVAVNSAEPFGLPATALAVGNLHDKWSALTRRVDDDMVQLAICDGDREACVSPAALRLLAIVDAARLREGRPESIETSSIHMDVIRDLKRINGHLTTVAYPILEVAGELAETRLKTVRPLTDSPASS